MSETTDSSPVALGAPGQQRGKRERLVAAATLLLHQQRVERTTLADIAKAADVPVGNVYYDFKTKDDIIAAVIETQLRQIKATLMSIEHHHSSPRSRLKALARGLGAQSEVMAEYGCPLGSLCCELDKRLQEPGLPVADLIRFLVDWAEEQFRSFGRPDAHDLALDLVASYEGSALLANTLRDPSILVEAAGRLGDWIDAL